mmetsp:Transcript_28513/g.47888  ORF Transcript_28513/g.47888 Transcript_28513/m.47888 type:complete len:278 (-) Transcript_28513:100-933(-)
MRSASEGARRREEKEDSVKLVSIQEELKEAKNSIAALTKEKAEARIAGEGQMHLLTEKFEVECVRMRETFMGLNEEKTRAVERCVAMEDTMKELRDKLTAKEKDTDALKERLTSLDKYSDDLKLELESSLVKKENQNKEEIYTASDSGARLCSDVEKDLLQESIATIQRLEEKLAALENDKGAALSTIENLQRSLAGVKKKEKKEDLTGLVVQERGGMEEVVREKLIEWEKLLTDAEKENRDMKMHMQREREEAMLTIQRLEKRVQQLQEGSTVQYS